MIKIQKKTKIKKIDNFKKIFDIAFKILKMGLHFINL